jgi:DNA replication and repair protein RecF
MILKSLQVTHFKNHQSRAFNFNDQINCIIGKNGAGKTNLLDAIYYLSFSKSAVGSSDRIAIHKEENVFTLYGQYNNMTIALQFEKGKSKIVKIDGQELEKLKDLIGQIPLVIILPDDTSMIKEGSEERRKFFDGALCQFNQDYLENLLKYNKLLKQRNTLLKNSEGVIDYKLLETYDDQLIPLSISISAERASIVDSFLPHLKKNYQELHEGEEVPGLRFKSHVEPDFESVFRENFNKDVIVQRTLLGCHKDDFEFSLNDTLIKKFGSQGQQKTFIISLKFALYDFLLNKTQMKPLLLLDDIFDKLDDSRIKLLVDLLSNHERFGQIFITDARNDRSKMLFKAKKEVNFIELTT